MIGSDERQSLTQIKAKMKLVIKSPSQLTQLRNKNRQSVLRAVYTGLAKTRVELAEVTGLTKPTVTKVTSELIEEGYLLEAGVGESTEEGGKRPRLLEFVPNVRQIIGVSIANERVSAVLTDLQGKVVMQHYTSIAGLRGMKVAEKLIETINALIVQLSVPLLCIGGGIPGAVDFEQGIILSAPHLGWENLPLSEILSESFAVPAYLANSHDLAALAQFAFSDLNGSTSLATVLANEDIGVGYVLKGAVYHSGAAIGRIRITHPDHPGVTSLENILGWNAVRMRAAPLQNRYSDPLLSEKLNYLHLRRAIQAGDPLALDLQETLSDSLTQVFAWVVTILHPQHLSLAGEMAHLGDAFLALVIRKTDQLLDEEVSKHMTFSLDTSPHLVSRGAVAQALQHELGLI
jgi:predicted NBD/HSP70 family sugar kinase